jgi:hypothetical protein
MRFNLVHIISGKSVNHGLYGYADVIESIRWGLEALGHEVAVVTNAIAKDSINMIFGIQLVNEMQARALPENTIAYNLEQLANLPGDAVAPVSKIVADRLQIWDYNIENLKFWRNFNPQRPPVHVPIGYAPTLTRIPPRRELPIDVLFYGIPTGQRLQTYYEICAKGMHAVFACGLYGQDRDDLIARSKIVLNLNMYNRSLVFEIARVSYLLANGKAVVSDRYPQTLMEPDMLEAVAFAPLEQIADKCLELVENEPARHELQERGRKIFEQRDIRAILTKALQASGI